MLSSHGVLHNPEECTYWVQLHLSAQIKVLDMPQIPEGNLVFLWDNMPLKVTTSLTLVSCFLADSTRSTHLKPVWYVARTFSLHSTPWTNASLRNIASVLTGFWSFKCLVIKLWLLNRFSGGHKHWLLLGLYLRVELPGLGKNSAVHQYSPLSIQGNSKVWSFSHHFLSFWIYNSLQFLHRILS